ncbi:MAG: UxaA family hydrolase, partial [Planctomycetota bacterium]
MSFIRLDPTDTVVTTTQALETGVAVEGTQTRALIPSGHKIATQAMAKGEVIRKYAQVIGYAAQDIAAGAHVHTHNVEFRNTDAAYEFGTNLRPATPATGDTFMGFRRENGDVGTRNYIAIVTSVNCSATAARMIAAHFTPEVLADYPNVDGVVAFVHG